MGIEYDNGSGSGSGSGSSMTDAEIRTAVENATDSNVFNDADHTKLNGIEAGATGDQTDAEIKTAVENATDSNVFTDADHTKLNGIETGATGDQTDTEIRTAVENATDSNVFTDADHTKLNNLLSLTSKGDLLSNNGSTDVALGVGTNGQVLVADSSTASGLKWQGNNTIGTKVIVQGSVNSTQSFSGGTAEKVDFVDNVTGGFDLNDEWDNTNHKFVVGSSGAGVYQFKSAYFIPNNAGWSRIYLEKNGTPIDFYYGNDWENSSSSWDTPNGIWNVELAVGDEICFYIYSSTNFTFNATYHSQNTFQITKLGDSITVNNVVAPTLNKTFTRESPTASDDLTIFRTDVAITVVEVIACSVGTSPSTTYQLKHSTDRNTSSGNNLTTSASTTSRTTGNIATLDDVTIPANSWIWYESTVASGTNVILTIDIRYTED